ncbi:MAG TPA: ribosome biogenesis GTPase Der [Firmicutes bacterium]|nr:ribosome biogenesis GTPase Der [Bacillota bacterium]
MNGLVAVVGRPNVGKSTFFNRMAGRRLSIVEDTPGVTRDRLYADVEWLGNTFTLIDTGGIELDSDDEFFSHMRRQAELAVDTADVILFFTDAREGLTADDRDVAQYLRRRHNNILLVVNKMDSPKQQDSLYDFYELGLGEPMAISAEQGLGLGDLLDEITTRLPKGEPQKDGGISIAVVGKPNAGKSSLVNKLLNEERSIVSDIPGTTRDALDTKFEFNGQPLTIIDTAGIRRKRSIEDGSIERYSVLRSLGAIRRCDVALILIDASAGITEQDVKIAGYVHEQGKASVVLVNKWDIIEKDTKTSEKFKKQLYNDLAFMDYVDVQFISAKTGQRLQCVLPAVLEAHAQSVRRIQTGVLNDVLNDAMAVNQPPSTGGRRLKIFYCTQVAVAPPTFIIFVNQTQLMHFSYERYLENCFRKAFGFKGTPIKIILRERDGEE